MHVLFKISALRWCNKGHITLGWCLVAECCYQIDHLCTGSAPEVCSDSGGLCAAASGKKFAGLVYFCAVALHLSRTFCSQAFLASNWTADVKENEAEPPRWQGHGGHGIEMPLGHDSFSPGQLHNVAEYIVAITTPRHSCGPPSLAHVHS